MSLNIDKMLDGLRCAMVLLDDAMQEFKTLDAIVKAKMSYDGFESVEDIENEKHEYLWRTLLCSVRDIKFCCTRSKKEVDELLNYIDEENENE